MATVEKPKHKKTKKAKERGENVSVVARNDDTSFEINSNKQTGEINKEINLRRVDEKVDNVEDRTELVEELTEDRLKQVEEFQTLANKAKQLLSLECTVASDQPIESLVEQSKCEPTTTNEEVSLFEELNEDSTNESNLLDDDSNLSKTSIEATAPPVEGEAGHSLNLASSYVEPPMNYPDLQKIQPVEKSAEIIYRECRLKSPGFSIAESELELFTADQLKQFYFCSELEHVKQFEIEYLTNSLLETYEDDPLFNALTDYYNFLSKVTMNLHDIKNCRKECLEKQDKIWISEVVTKTVTGLCMDNKEVKATFEYDVMKVSQRNLQIATEAIERLFQQVCFNFVTNRFAAATAKVKIDQIINKIVTHRCTDTLDGRRMPGLLSAIAGETLECMTQLRKALSILFYFIRKPSPNKTFSKETRRWLTQLVSLHLLLATKEDHWFLLFNLLRCPSGIKNWGVSFVQIPIICSETSQSTMKPLVLMSAEMNHCITILQILLKPIQKRNEYLRAFSQDVIDCVKDERWILIDSDGEDSHNSAGEYNGIKENDLMALLNQIPFEQIFCSALHVEKFLNDYIIDESLITSNKMLEAISFFSNLIDILGEGMITYNNENYKQLAKRLGYFIRHILQYALDYYELYTSNKTRKEVTICERIIIELNSLLLKACSYIYKTRNLATWQYFLTIPYQNLYSETIWQIFYCLNIGFPNNVTLPDKDYIKLFRGSDFWQQFNIVNADLSDEDLYYMLHAFFEMANGRNQQKDWDLLKTICLTIFNVGFGNINTRENCYKTARDMLVNLTLLYEDLISTLLLEMKFRFNDLDNVIYLFKSLPLENWKPGMDSFEILSNWLLNFDFKSSENMCARLIISHLNWSFGCDGRLFLPHNIHVRMACLISEALTKHTPEVIGVFSITEGVKQVSNFLDFSQGTKEHFKNWCWAMISVLHLHIMDQSVDSIKKTLQNPVEPLMFIPELDRVDIIYQGVKDNRPLSMILAILVTLHGHSIPLICQKGFDLMKILLTDYRYAAVTRCIELVIPLFLDSPETLANCENFQKILNTLLNADKTYMRMATDIIYPNFVGPVMEIFDNMIHHQICSYTSFGLASPQSLINIWLMCFTSLPMWQTSPVVYLLNKIVRLAYQFPDARNQTIEYFQKYYKDCTDWKGSSKLGVLKSLFGSNPSKIPDLSPNYPWLALLLLEIEYQYQDSIFWQEYLRQLSKSLNNINVETALKKTLNVCKLQQFPAEMLVLYKYANLIAVMDFNCPLFPIICQKFFELYLSRVPLYFDEQNFQDIYGVSNKFYEFNLPLMKKIKKNLESAETMYKNKAGKYTNDDSFSYFLNNCGRLMRTFIIWLEDTEINKLSINENHFQYPQSDKLKEILNGNTPHWTEYIYLRNIRKVQKEQADYWAANIFRLRNIKEQRTAVQKKQSLAPVDRIKRYLASYDKCKEAPIYSKPSPMTVNEINQNTLKVIKGQISLVKEFAENFHLKSAELNSLNRNYLETVLNLYKQVAVTDCKNVTCDFLIFKKCSGNAYIRTEIYPSTKDTTIETKLNKYQENQNVLIDQLLNLQTDSFAQNVELMRFISKLLRSYQSMQVNASQVIITTGIEFFYNIINNMCGTVLEFEPSNTIFTQILDELGVFIQDNQDTEGEKILKIALKQPQLIKVVSGVFVPYKTVPECFLKLYKFLIDSYLKRCDPKVLFVLFSKFDLVHWLEHSQPKLNEINKLLLLILQGLESWSQPDSILIQDQFRRHLVHIFEYDFPQHYGEVLQAILDRVSDQKLMPIVLLDVLNSLLRRGNCENISLESTSDKIHEISSEFARKQNLFNLKASIDSLTLFSRHFRQERCHHGLHGLYPKHKDYCKPLAAWFCCLGHVVVTTAICSYQELLADQISEIVFQSLMDMYDPWIGVYITDNINNPTSNWIRQLSTNDKVLYPWSEQHSGTCKIIINTFTRTLQFVLDHLPTSYKILDYIFEWYVDHFAIPGIEKHVYGPIHEGIASLPWEHFRPQQIFIEKLYESVQKFIPECHAMLGHIFIRINWLSWFQNVFPMFHDQMKTISKLFVVFIKIAFEPNIHIHINTSKILEDAINYPWHMVEYGETENLLQWFVATVEPAIILKIPTETNYSDRAVLDLIRVTCAMDSRFLSAYKASNATAKRIIYVRSMMRLLKACAAKNQRFLSTKDGKASFQNAFFKLLHEMDSIVKALSSIKTIDERKNEALNFLIEILIPMQTQSEETSNQLLDALYKWIDNCAPGNLMMLATLNATNHMKQFISGIYYLIEITIAKYLCYSDACSEWHQPSWANLMKYLAPSLSKLELMPIIQGPYLYTLQVFIIFKFEQIDNLGDKITFLQDLCQLVEGFKIGVEFETRLSLIWGVLISKSCWVLSTNEHAKKPLLMLAKYLQIASTESEGWSNSLLGAVGLKKEAISNKRRILTRCLACVILSILPDTTSTSTPQPTPEFNSALRELSYLIANKKFQYEKHLITKVLCILNEDHLPELRNVPHLVCRLIDIFYESKSLTTIPEVWDFDYKIT